MRHSYDAYGRYEPGAQNWHTADDDAPETFEKDPTLQAMHAPLLGAPDAVEYFPASQRLHSTDPDSENVPATHLLQAAELVALTTVEYVPATQLRQVALLDARTVVEYVPSGQFVHSDPIDEEKVPA